MRPVAGAAHVHLWFGFRWILAAARLDGSEVFRLEFDRAHSYGSLTDGITLPIVLRSGREAVWLTAKVDTGASHCLFKRGQGELLGLDIETGNLKNRAWKHGLAAFRSGETVTRTSPPKPPMTNG